MISCQKFAQAAKTFNRVEIFFNQELFTLRPLAVVRKIADRPSRASGRTAKYLNSMHANYVRAEPVEA
jgi:hypothetical protein